MKKLMILFMLLLVNLPVILAPESGVVTIIINNPIQRMYPVQDVLQAIIFVETGNKGKGAYNRNEPQAKGLLQEWPILVRDVNRILGWKKYKLDDRLNNKKAIEMFWIYQNYYNPELTLDKMARIWCGGPDGHLQKSSLVYLQLVKDRLYN